MNLVTRLARSTTVILLLLSVGCASAGLSPANFTVRTVSQTASPELFDHAEATLVTLGLSIDRRDPAGGVLTSVPFDAATDLASRRTPAIPGPHDRKRRVAQLHLTDEAGATRVYCKVAIQTQVTQTYRLLAIDQGGSDLPDKTPIEYGGSPGTRQDTVWQTSARDKAAERTILDEIMTRAGG